MVSVPAAQYTQVALIVMTGKCLQISPEAESLLAEMPYFEPVFFNLPKLQYSSLCCGGLQSQNYFHCYFITEICYCYVSWYKYLCFLMTMVLGDPGERAIDPKGDSMDRLKKSLVYVLKLQLILRLQGL